MVNFENREKRSDVHITNRIENPEDLLKNLKERATLLDNEDLDAVIKLIKEHENLLRDKNTQNQLKREIIASLAPLRLIRKNLKAKLKTTTPSQESKKPEKIEIDQRIYDESLFPQIDRDSFLANFQLIPDYLKDQYAKRIIQAIKSRDEASAITSLRGATFEMIRINTIIQQELEEISNKIPPVNLRYLGYSKKETTFQDPPQKEKRGSGNISNDPKIDFDVPIIRNGKPYIYETKSYPRKAYGFDAQAYNQALKYQTAINQGIVDGATIELRGRIDQKFMRWSFGFAIGEESYIPDIEIIYNIELPSGKEFRFPIKRAENGNSLKFENEEVFDDNDQIYVRTLERLCSDSHAIVELVTAIHVNEHDASDELKPYLEDPSKITTRELFEEYDRLRKDGLLQIIKEKAESYKINSDNRHSAVEYAQMEPLERRKKIEQLVLDYQLFLQQNPQEAAVKRHYVLREEDYELAFNRVDEMLAKISDFEIEREKSPEEAKKRIHRTKNGYLGQPEGIALDAHHVMFDAVYGINKESIESSRTKGILNHSDLDYFFETVREGRISSRFRTIEDFDHALENDLVIMNIYKNIGRKKQGKLRKLIKEAQFVRSYNWPERFLTSETLDEYLDNADRYTLDIYILDPTKKIDPNTGEPRPHKQESTTAIDVEKTEIGIVTENIKRAEAYIKDTNREQQHKREIKIIKNNIVRLKKEQGERMKDAQSNARQGNKRIGSEIRELSIGIKKLRTEAQKPEIDTARINEIKIQIADMQNNLLILQEERSNLFSKVKTISAEYQPQIAELNRELEEVYKKIIPKTEWDTFGIYISKKIEKNEMKTIYFIDSDGEIIIQEEIIRGDVTGRAAHSELGSGRNGYGMGELKFERLTESGNIVRPGEDGVWKLVEYNNGSGHYRPDSNTSLPYVLSVLKEKGIDVDIAKPFDAILRGRPIRNML